MKAAPDLVGLVDDMKTDDFLVLCSLVIARAVVDLGASPAAAFFAAGVLEVSATIAEANAAAVPAKE
jgi:hypothetical protein